MAIFLGQAVVLYLIAMASVINQKIVVSLDVERVNDGVCETLEGNQVDCCTLADYPGLTLLNVMLVLGFVWAGLTWNNVKMASVAGRGLGCRTHNLRTKYSTLRASASTSKRLP